MSWGQSRPVSAAAGREGPGVEPAEGDGQVQRRWGGAGVGPVISSRWERGPRVGAGGGRQTGPEAVGGGRAAAGHIGNSLWIPPPFSVESEEELQGAGWSEVCREM